MALKAVVDSLDSVEEQFRSLYVEKDGRFILSVEGLDSHPDTEALSNALKRVRTEKQTLKDKLTAAETRLTGLPDDFDAEVYEDLKAKAEGSAGTDESKIAERLERQKQALETKHTQALETERAKTEKRDKALRKHMIDGGLTEALVAAGISKEYLAATKAMLKESGRIKLVEEDDDYKVYADNGIDEHTPLNKYVTDWASTDEGKPFISKPKGGDAQGGNGSNLGENPFDDKGGKVKPNLTKQQEIIAANPEKARQLAKAVGKPVNW